MKDDLGREGGGKGKEKEEENEGNETGWIQLSSCLAATSRNQFNMAAFNWALSVSDKATCLNRNEITRLIFQNNTICVSKGKKAGKR